MSIKKRELSRISVIKSDDVQRLSTTSSIPLDFLKEVSDRLPNRHSIQARNETDQSQRTTVVTRSVDHEAVSNAVAQAVKVANEQHAAAIADIHDKHTNEIARLSEQNDKRLQQLTTDVATAMAAADASMQEFFADAQPAMIDLSISIADTLTGAPLNQTIDSQQSRSDVDVIKSSVSWAIEELSRDQSIDIYLNPDTLRALNENVQLETLTHGARLRWHARPELAAEDWVASSPQTTLRRVRTEIIDRIRSILTESLASAGSTPVADPSEEDNEPQGIESESSIAELPDIELEATHSEDVSRHSEDQSPSGSSDVPTPEENQERNQDEGLEDN